MIIENLITHWTNELQELQNEYNEAFKSDNTNKCYEITGMKKQLIRCIAQLKNLNEETSKDFGKENCEVHETVLIRWAHKCKKCGKIFEGH